MKKKKFNGLSLKKNVISRLNSSSIMGGAKVTKVYPCPVVSNHNSCISDGCDVLTRDCGPTEQGCHSIHIACE